MKYRAFLLGLMGAALLNAVCYFNDFVMRQGYLVGSYLPMPIYGGLLLFILFFNAPMRRWFQRWSLTGRELAIIIAVLLAASYVPGRGLMHYFQTFQMFPHHYAATRPNWKSAEVIDVAPERMLAKVTEDVAAGELVSAQEKSLVVSEGTLNPEESYTGMFVVIRDEFQRAQRRSISECDFKTNKLTVDRKWSPMPSPGWRVRILRSLEDEVMTPYMQGQLAAFKKSPFARIQGTIRGTGENTLTLSGDASNVDDAYVGLRIDAEYGQGREQTRIITDYDGESRLVTVDRPWAPELEMASAYRITHPHSKHWWQPWREQLLSGKITGATESSVTLDIIASDADDALCDQKLTVTTQDGRKQTRTIVNYTGTTREATLDAPWKIVPTAGDSYEIILDTTILAPPSDAIRGKLLSASGNTLTLTEDASHRDNVYAGMMITMTDGPAKGQMLRISKYDGTKQVVTVVDPKRPDAEADKVWKVAPVAGNSYVIKPKAMIPWHAWRRSLMFWVPLLMCFSIGMIALALVTHEQWSKHELLAYPIAQFAGSLMEQEEKKLLPSVLRARGFWIAAGVVLFIHMNNYACQWWPDLLIRVPLRFDFTAFRELSSVLKRTWSSWRIFYPTFFFAVIGFSYFLSSDVSLSLGLAPYVFSYALGIFSIYGISVGGPMLAAKPESFMYAGAFTAILVTMIYSGRHYYLSVAKQSFFLKVAETDLNKLGKWSFRIFIISMLLFAAQLIGVGLEWPLALLYTVGAVAIFLVTSRIVAETGAFFIHPWFFPCALMWGVLGERALGPRSLTIMLLVSSLLLIDPREALMPFMTHALKIADDQKAPLGKTALAGGLAVAIAFAVAIPATLYWQYSKGTRSVSDGWSMRAVPSFALSHTAKIKQRLQAQGVLEEAETQPFWSRIFKISARKDCVISFIVVFGLAMVCCVGRLRYPKWPIHPVMFAVLGTFQSKMLGPSFLLGWLIKVLINKFGGTHVHQKLKPIFLGLIAGEMLSGVIPMIIGAIYYMITGESPPSFIIFRG